MAKQTPCCARKTSEVTRAQSEVGRLARYIAAKQARGQRTDHLSENLDRAKRDLATAKQAVIDHEADHAAEEAVPA